MEQFWIWLWYVVRDLVAFFAWFCWAALIVGLMLVERRRRRNRAVRPPDTIEPECANCGYLVVGITSTRCPECGSDLRGRGTILDRYLYTSTTAKAVVCLLLLSVPAYFGWRRVERELPIWRQSSLAYVLNSPMSGAYRSVVIKMSMERWEWPRRRYDGPPFEIAEIRLTHLSGAERSMRARLYGKPWEWTGMMMPSSRPADASDAGRVSAADVLRWMRTQEIDTSDALVERETREVAELIEAKAFRGPLTLNSTFVTRTPVGAYYFDRPWWMLGGWVGLCVAAWLVAMRFVTRGKGIMHDAVIPATAMPDTGASAPR